ncbi:DUF2510 domain-containing protein [uncultured Jatrophihabitans sp.]|uniref:DUF2510 domain-containing protein n=1 Tax=uncultured Jatrophihabitans sp. TaxID=1610747 RepID=UPI0035CC93C6
MNPVAQWYIDPADPTKERYWNGSRWQDGSVRDITPGALSFGEASIGAPSTGRVAQPSEPARLWLVAAAFIWLVALLAVIGTVIAFYKLHQHRAGIDCDDYGCGGFTYNYRDASYGVLAGGLVQALVLAVVASLCQAMDKVRAAGQLTR